MAYVPRGYDLTQVHVPSLGVDGERGVVLLQPLWSGLGQEIEDGLPLLQNFQGIVSSTEPFHCPRGIKHSKETTSAACTRRPEGLGERGTERGIWVERGTQRGIWVERGTERRIWVEIEGDRERDMGGEGDRERDMGGEGDREKDMGGQRRVDMRGNKEDFTTHNHIPTR
jgi:hypothetical protein